MGNRPSAPTVSTSTTGSAQQTAKKVYAQGSIILTLSAPLQTGNNQIAINTLTKRAFLSINKQLGTMFGFRTFSQATLPNGSTPPTSETVVSVLSLPYITAITPGANTAVLLQFTLPPQSTSTEEKAKPAVKNVFIPASSSPITTNISDIIANLSNKLTSSWYLTNLFIGTEVPQQYIDHLTASTTPASDTSIPEAFTVNTPMGEMNISLPDNFDRSDDAGNYHMYLMLVVILVIILYYIYVKGKEQHM